MWKTVETTEEGVTVTFNTDKVISMTRVDKKILRSDLIIQKTDDEKPVTLVKCEHQVAFATHATPEEIIG